MSTPPASLPGDDHVEGARGRRLLRALLRPRVLAILALLVVAFLVSRGCQQAQVRVTQDQAVATAREQVDFRPARTQVRLVRQGLISKPFWAVSLSIPGARQDEFRRLVTVRIDANNGTVAAINREQ